MQMYLQHKNLYISLNELYDIHVQELWGSLSSLFSFLLMHVSKVSFIRLKRKAIKKAKTIKQATQSHLKIFEWARGIAELLMGRLVTLGDRAFFVLHPSCGTNQTCGN